MKLLIAVTCLALMTTAARADGPGIYAPPPGPYEYKDSVNNAKITRTSGAILAAVGVAMAVGSGIIAAVGGGVVPDCTGRECQAFNAAVGLGVTSSVLVSVGIPLWAVGQDRVDQLTKLRPRVSAFADAQGAHTGLSFNF